LWNTPLLACSAERPNTAKPDIQHGTRYNELEKVVFSKYNEGERKSQKRALIGGRVPIETTVLKMSPQGMSSGLEAPALLTHATEVHGRVLVVCKPVLIGKGIPLFANTKKHRPELKLVENKLFGCDVMALNYIAAS
jgi:hypothetical protein